MTAPVRAGTVGPAMDRIHRAVHRLGAADQQRRDVALAVALGVAMAIELAFTATMRNPGITFPLIAVFVAPVAFRTRAPVPALVATWSILVLGAAVGATLDESFVAFLTGVLLVWTVASRTERLRVVLAADAFCVAALISLVAFESSVGISDVLWSAVMVVVLPTVGARLVHSSGRLSDLLAERARSLELEQDERARLAAARERERIAAELHDVVAHGVSAMVIQAAAARRIITTGGDPDAGREAIAEVEGSGRAALDELRRLLGVLRRGDEALALAPQPSLARVDRLVARLRDEGLPVELEVDGRPGGLPAGLDVTAYRIVEEALGEVLRLDGAVPTRVSVRYRPRELELEVVDEGGPRRRTPSPDDGLGLRERVALFGGSLHAGRRRGGGWAMSARLPIEREAA
jgi:signal transduction histidine kinase